MNTVLENIKTKFAHKEGESTGLNPSAGQATELEWNKIKTFIENNSSDKNSLWLMGEKEWSFKFNKNILQNTSQSKKPEKSKKNKVLISGITLTPGIFLTDFINWEDFDAEYGSCIRLVFFNNEEQFLFIRIDTGQSNYLGHHSKLQSEPEAFRNIYFENTHPGDDQSKLNKNKPDSRSRFEFAKTTGAVHALNKGHKVKVVMDKTQTQWRLTHD